MRLFQLLESLRGRTRPVAAQSIAEALGVSLRTIYRDMATLQAMGAPIRGESGLGYQLEAGYFLPPMGFDADELDAIVLGTRLVAARGDEELTEAARRVTAKIGAVLSNDTRQHFEHLPLRVASAQGDATAHVPGMMRTLRLAIRDHAILQIEYSDLQKRRSLREIRPLGLTMFDQVWLLTAWCEHRDSFRNFRLDRLRSARRIGRRFTLERGKRFEDYLQQI
jgi:predicted DNA-binding transcriptional regulator YafY